jgi:hypothetical protein
VEPRERGQRAHDLVNDPLFKEALAATSARAMEAFARSKTPEEAWNARLRSMAVDEFAAYMLAVIQFGRAETEKLVRAREKMRASKRDKESFEEYLNKAREARDEFDESIAKVANG